MRAFLLALSILFLAVQPATADIFKPKKRDGFGGFMKGASAPWLKSAVKDVGKNPTGWSSRWCGRYMRGVMPNPISSNRAVDWKHYGKPLKGPKVGAVAVMPHHVGIVKDFDGASVTLVSGNTTGRVVGVTRYSRSRIVAYRWP